MGSGTSGSGTGTSGSAPSSDPHGAGATGTSAGPGANGNGHDAARLYRLALESAPAGPRLHAVAEEGTAFRAIAGAIGRGLGLPATSVSADEAGERLGLLARFAQLDHATSSATTRALPRWHPEHPGLLAELAGRHYFDESPSRGAAGPSGGAGALRWPWPVATGAREKARPAPRGRCRIAA